MACTLCLVSDNSLDFSVNLRSNELLQAGEAPMSEPRELGTQRSGSDNPLVNVKPTNGRSLPENSLLFMNSSRLAEGLAGSNSSKLEVSSLLATLGINGGVPVEQITQFKILHNCFCNYLFL